MIHLLQSVNQNRNIFVNHSPQFPLGLTVGVTQFCVLTNETHLVSDPTAAACRSPLPPRTLLFHRPFPQPLATAAAITVSTDLHFLEFHTLEIIYYVALSDWLFLLAVGFQVLPCLFTVLGLMSSHHSVGFMTGRATEAQLGYLRFRAVLSGAAVSTQARVFRGPVSSRRVVAGPRRGPCSAA